MFLFIKTNVWFHAADKKQRQKQQEELKKQGFKIGLISNCYFEEAKVIRDSALFSYFDAVCLSCELGIRKPEEAIYER